MENIFNEVDRVLTDVINILSSFTNEEINSVPFDGSWTAGEVAEHISITLGGYIQQLDGPVNNTRRPYDEKVSMLREMFLNFDVKYNSPASAYPETKHYNKERLLHKLEALKQHLNHYDQAADLTLTCVSFEFPGGIGYITRIENLHFLVYHTQRHLHQLKNIYKTIHHTKINQL